MKVNIIGAGISGLTIAAKLAQNKIHCKLIESRSKVGGNCSSHFDGEIEVHDYGPHIFHTSNDEVWSFIQQYSKFNSFQLNVLAQHNGKKYHLPFGLDLVNSFFNIDLPPFELENFLAHKRDNSIKHPQNLEEQALKLVGKEIYEAFIKHYTTKQWNADPKTLPAYIIKRLPFRSTYDNNYFNDIYQGIPVDGYQRMFEKMCNSKYIQLKLLQHFKLDDIANDEIYFYTGPIDKLLDFKFGALSWRSLKFEYEKHNVDSYQGCAIVNYVEKDVSYTRIYEYKHFHPETSYAQHKTIICKEYPAEYSDTYEPYYPIETQQNIDLYNKYVKMLKKSYPNIILCGRLAQNKYLDMDDAIANALQTVNLFFTQKLI